MDSIVIIPFQYQNACDKKKKNLSKDEVAYHAEQLAKM